MFGTHEKVLKVSLSSKKVGIITIKGQPDLDSLLSRANAAGLIPSRSTNAGDLSSKIGKYDDYEEINVVTKFEDINEMEIYETTSLRFEGDSISSKK